MKLTIGKKTAIKDNGTAQNAEFKTFTKCKEETRELIGKRSKRCKCYAINKQNIIAEFHGNPVHFRKGNAYEEIDNTLIDRGDYFETKNAGFSTRFLKHTKDGKIFEMEMNHCKVGLISCDILKKSECTIEKISSNSKETRKSDRLILREIKEGTDLEYVVDSARVKENIIIKNKKEDYAFDFELSVDNLIVGISDDGKSLELIRKDTGNPQFIIPAPFMTDAKGVRSDSVYYEIIHEKTDSIRIKVVADKKWINDKKRSFPVKIDPVISVWQPDNDSYYGLSLFGAESYYDNGYGDSVFRYLTYEYHGARGYLMPDDNIGYVSGNELRVYGYFDEEGGEVHVDCKLLILKNKIPEKMRNNIVNAKVILNVTEDSEGGEVIIKGRNNNDYFISPGERIELDITNDFYVSGDVIEIPIIDFHDRGGCADKNIIFEPPILELEFKDHEVGIEVAVDPIKTKYFPGEYFDCNGMLLNKVYWSGKKESLLPDDCDITPKYTLATYDKFVTIVYDGFSIRYGIDVLNKGFNDRRPKDNFENVYRAVLVDPNTGMASEKDGKAYYIKLELYDGAQNDECLSGTPLNAENINKNIIVNGANIYGKVNEEAIPDIQADKISGIIREKNLPVYLRQSNFFVSDNESSENE